MENKQNRKFITNNSKLKTPSLRFAGFCGEWEEKRLGEVAEITSSKRVYSSDYVKTGIPFFRGKEISELKRSKTVSDVLYIKESKFLEFKNNFGVPRKDDILITSVGTLGNIYKINLDYDFYFKDGNLIWLKNLAVNSSFLEIVLDFHKRDLLKGVIGSTQKALTIDGIKKVEILLPTISEQQKIAEFFGAVDEWIENLRAQKENLEFYKKGMMQKIFSQEVRFKDDNGNDFAEWEEKRLGEVAVFLKGKGISKDDIAKDGKNKCIRYGELYTQYNEIIKDVISYTNTTKEKSILSKENDILMPTSDVTPNGLATASALNEPNIILGGDILVIRSTKILNTFFSYYVKAHKKDIMKLVSGVTVYHIYGSDLKNLKFLFPSFSEQQKIADFLTSIDNLINSKQQQITQAEQWKKGLMQGLFV